MKQRMSDYLGNKREMTLDSVLKLTFTKSCRDAVRGF